MPRNYKLFTAPFPSLLYLYSIFCGSVSPLVAIVHICGFIFQTCPVTISTLLVYKLKEIRHSDHKGLFLWKWRLQSLLVISAFWTQLINHCKWSSGTTISLGVFLLFVATKFDKNNSNIVLATSVTPLAKSYHCCCMIINACSSLCPFRATVNVWRMLTATCHCPQPATTTVTLTSRQH